MKKLAIGITCYPSVGGSGIVASQLGSELARLGHRVHFISYEPPFRLDLNQPNVEFHPVKINEYQLFKYPDYTLPLAVKMMACLCDAESSGNDMSQPSSLPMSTVDME